MGTVPARHLQSTEQQRIYARAVKRTDWASRALTAAGEDLREAAPHLSSLADYLTATGTQTAAVAEAMRGR